MIPLKPLLVAATALATIAGALPQVTRKGRYLYT